jgi:hypothetical protein
MSLIIKDLSASTTVDQATMSAVRGGNIVSGGGDETCPVDPYPRCYPPPPCYPPSFPRCVGWPPIGFYPPCQGPGEHPEDPRLQSA